MAEAEETEPPAEGAPVTLRVPVDPDDPLAYRHYEYVSVPAESAQHWDVRLWRRA
jgi:cyanate lyase